jgi:hypothetical protein
MAMQDATMTAKAIMPKIDMRTRNTHPPKEYAMPLSQFGVAELAGATCGGG